MSIVIAEYYPVIVMTYGPMLCGVPSFAIVLPIRRRDDIKLGKGAVWGLGVPYGYDNIRLGKSR